MFSNIFPRHIWSRTDLSEGRIEVCAIITELIRKIIQQLENYLEHYFGFLPVSPPVSGSIESLEHFSIKLINFDGQD